MLGFSGPATPSSESSVALDLLARHSGRTNPDYLPRMPAEFRSASRMNDTEIVTFVICVFGSWYIRRTERTFANVI
jgi:hypothetical protein